MGEALVICIGTETRADDGIGLAVAHHLATAHPGVEVTCAAGEPIELIDLWSPWNQVVVVDAVATGAEPGTVRILDATVDRVPVAGRTSSHGIGLADAIELGRSLGRLPGRLSVVGVEVADVTPGRPMTGAVAEAVPRAAAAVLQELSRA